MCCVTSVRLSREGLLHLERRASVSRAKTRCRSSGAHSALTGYLVTSGVARGPLETGRDSSGVTSISGMTMRSRSSGRTLACALPRRGGRRSPPFARTKSARLPARSLSVSARSDDRRRSVSRHRPTNIQRMLHAQPWSAFSNEGTGKASCGGYVDCSLLLAQATTLPTRSRFSRITRAGAAACSRRTTTTPGSTRAGNAPPSVELRVAATACWNSYATFLSSATAAAVGRMAATREGMFT